MKRFIALTALSLGLAIGTTACANQQLISKRTAKNAALGTAVIAGLVLSMFLVPCSECNETGVQPSPR
jgi:hypothetical protein